jgi:membrane protein EpsK
LVSPSLAALQASDDSAKLSLLSSKAVRMQGLLIAIPVGVLCGLAGPALNWWLGPNFTFLAPLAWFVLVPLVIEGAFYPAFILIQTHEAISFTAIATAVIGLTNVLLGIALVKFTRLGMYGIAVSVAITSIIRHAIVLPAYAARVLRQPWYLYIQQQSQVVIQLGVTGVIAFLVSQYLTASRSFLQLVLAALFAGGIATILALLQLSADERARLLGIIRRR